MIKKSATLLITFLCLTARAQTTQPSGKYANVVDQLDMIDSAETWSYGTLENANVQPDYPARIELGFKEKDFPRQGSWTGDIIPAKFPFTELIASFNLKTPGQTGVILDIRVKQGETWSPWLYMQSWGKTGTAQRTVKFDDGKVDVDTIFLTKPAEAYQARLSLQGFDFEKNRPSVRRLAICYSGKVEDSAERAKLNPPTTVPADWARDIPVPFRGQGDFKNPKSLWGQICSPTSTSMVMEYWGVNLPTVENALAIYDSHWDLFGNWGRAVTRAGEMGLDAYLRRFRNWDQVKAVIAEGTPIIASIRFKKGQVQGFLYEYTPGHLIVIRGLTPQGDIIVNDPAKRDKGNHVIYPAKGMETAWFNNGGVGYVIKKPTPPATQPSFAGPQPDGI